MRPGLAISLNQKVTKYQANKYSLFQLCIYITMYICICQTLMYFNRFRISNLNSVTLDNASIFRWRPSQLMHCFHVDKYKTVEAEICTALFPTYIALDLSAFTSNADRGWKKGVTKASSWLDEIIYFSPLQNADVQIKKFYLFPTVLENFNW